MAPGGRQFAGFGVRLVAYLIDVAIFFAAYIVFAVIAGVTRSSGVALFLYLILVVASIGYFLYCWTQRNGQTIGHQVMHLRVVKNDGSPITMGTAVIRYIGYIVNSIICGLPIGFIWAAFDAQKQGWHDKIAGTYVGPE
jgi:uncharacterized RDD family membrane protein YckC